MDRRSPLERVLERTAIDPYGCWLYEGSLTSHGYGHLIVIDKNWMAHRAVYIGLVGPIPPGLELDHLCRVRHCVNPLHLEPVTHAENIRRGFAVKPNPTHCPRGHDYAVYGRKRKDGRVDCRECDRLRGCRDKRANWTDRTRTPKDDPDACRWSIEVQ